MTHKTNVCWGICRFGSKTFYVGKLDYENDCVHKLCEGPSEKDIEELAFALVAWDLGVTYTGESPLRLDKAEGT